MDDVPALPDDLSHEPTDLDEAKRQLVIQQKVIAQQAAEIADLRAKLISLDAHLRRMLRRLVFPRSETMTHPDQQTIPEVMALAEQLAAIAPLPPVTGSEPPAATTVAPPARRRGGRGLRTLPAHLDIVEDRIELAPAQRQDTDGSVLVPVGEERSERLDFEPGRFLRRVQVRVRYGRRDTREPVVTAPIPPAIVARGLPCDRLVLQIAYAKYVLGQPLHRQRIDWLRHGVDLTVQTACGWMEQLANRLSGLVGAIRQQVLAEPYLHLDDTTMRLVVPDHHRCATARVWCYRGGGQVFYDFTRTRAGHWCQDLLRGYSGYVVADAYSGHDRLFIGDGRAREVACWAHARRDFRHLVDQKPIAREIIELVQALYAIDDAATALTARTGADHAATRFHLRQQQAPAILAAIRARCEIALLREHRSAVLTQAAAYILNHWAALCRFLEAGYLPLDNNPAEQALRPVAIGRKNHLFVASEDGGDWLATNLTIFQTCRLMGIDPIDYLRDVLPGIITGRTTDLLTVTPRAYLAQMTDVRTA